MRGLTDMKNGAVSVAPRPVSIGTRAAGLLHREFVEAVPDVGDSAAPEKNIACSRAKNFARSAASSRRYGSSDS